MQDLNPEKQLLKLSDELSLTLTSLHEIMGSASESLALTIAAKLTGSIIWIGRNRDVSTITPAALKRFIDPSRMVLTEGMSRKEVLWAAEQALRSKGAELTVIQLELGPDLKESRRLQLACEQGGGLGLVLISRRAQSSCAQTRWTCNPVPANDNPLSMCWVWEQTKNRQGILGCWTVRWEGDHDAPRNVHMVA